MRKTAAALVIAILAVATLVAPTVDAEPAPPLDQIRCGTVGPPVCDVLQELQTLLAPLEPVFALAEPVLGDLGQGVQQLLSLSKTKAGLDPAAALDAGDALQDALSVLPAPIVDLLGKTVLRQLDAALDDLAAALAPVLEPIVGEPAAEGGSKPVVMPKPAPAPTAAPSSPAAADVDLSGSALDSGSTSSSDIPDVPNGGVLHLGPLAVPEATWTAEPSTAALDAAPVTEEQAVLATAVAGRDPIGANGTSTGLVVVTFSLLLCAGAAAAQWYQARRASRTIPD